MSSVRSVFIGVGMLILALLNGSGITAEAIAQKTRDSTDCGHAYSGQLVNAPIGKAFQQQTNHLPAVDQRLQFGGCTQVFEKITAIFH